MRKLRNKLVATSIASLLFSGAALALEQPRNQPPPSDCYGIKIFGICITYAK